MQEVPATLSNVRRFAVALWWKIVVVMGLWLFVSRFVLGFLDFVIPSRQLEFWFATLITNVVGEGVAEQLWFALETTGAVLGTLASSVVDLAVLLLTLNWLLARHIGRYFGRYRLTLQRGE